MINKICLKILILMFLSVGVKAQFYSELLKTIEENNKELQAGKSHFKSMEYEHKLGNIPSGPELSYGYFPDNSTVSGTKEVFGISQSFQMPCYYRNQSKYSKLLIDRERQVFEITRKNILAKAKELLIEYIYLLKQSAIVDKRLKMAEDIYHAYLVKLETGDANALEVNKAKLYLLNIQQQENNLKTGILSVKEQLNTLNGSKNLSLNINEYPIDKVLDIDSVWFDRLENDPYLAYIQKSTDVSVQRMKVVKNLQLPGLSLGYGTETVADEKFKGFIIGLSIPLWNSNRAIQQARAEADFFLLSKSAEMEKALSETRVLYKKVESKKENLESYSSVLQNINNEEILAKSLEMGEISILEYFMEMIYFYDVVDGYLLVEKEYHQALAELLKYKL